MYAVVTHSLIATICVHNSHSIAMALGGEPTAPS